MPVLPNPKHEAFAQARVKGKSADEAYAAAGYKPHRGNAHRLSTNESVVARVTELQTASVERTLVTVESLTQELEDIRIAAKAAGQNAAATSAVMGKAKLHGLLVDKLEADITHHLSDLSDDELEREISMTLAEPQQETAH
jgi:predicted house-cleaning NTP pyrophosphatase (Maf/HAM1 superfamily)